MNEDNITDSSRSSDEILRLQYITSEEDVEAHMVPTVSSVSAMECRPN